MRRAPHPGPTPAFATHQQYPAPHRTSVPQDVDEALKRLPQEVVDARNQRLKRATDLSMKHSELPKELQQLQTPYDFYMKDTLDVRAPTGSCCRRRRLCPCRTRHACPPTAGWAGVVPAQTRAARGPMLPADSQSVQSFLGVVSASLRGVMHPAEARPRLVLLAAAHVYLDPHGAPCSAAGQA